MFKKGRKEVCFVLGGDQGRNCSCLRADEGEADLVLGGYWKVCSCFKGDYSVLFLQIEMIGRCQISLRDYGGLKALIHC